MSGRQFNTGTLEVVFENPLEVHLFPGVVRGFQVGQVPGNNFLFPVLPRKGFLQEVQGAISKKITRH